MKVPAYARAQQSETALQIAVAGHLNKYLAPPAMFTAFPAGGGGYDRGAKLKAMGLKAGMPDIQIFWNDRVYMIELKTFAKGSGLSADQRYCHTDIYAALPSCEIAVCRTLEEVQSKLDEWQLPRLAVSKNNESMQKALEKSFGSSETF